MSEIYYAFQSIFILFKIIFLFGIAYIGWIMFDSIGKKNNK